MATYPPRIVLTYQVGNQWREERILAGEPAPGQHRLSIELDWLDSKLRDRALAVAKRISTLDDCLEVIGSGISPSQVSGGESAVDPIHERIGVFPELACPTHDPEELIEAYERWIERYDDRAGSALAAWIERDASGTDHLTARVRESVGDDDIPFLDWWQWEIHWRVGDGPRRVCIVDGKENLLLFQRARGAWQAVVEAGGLGDDEDWNIAQEVVGTVVDLPRKPADLEELVGAYEDQCERFAELLRAHVWARQRQREGFEQEMRRWAFDQGSERLQIGLQDGYRMVPVYLSERIAAEVPGFYAYLPKANDGVSWNPRTGPSEPALRLRRAVQERIRRHCPPGMGPPKAEIVWVKEPPADMWDEDTRHPTGFTAIEPEERPFEAIAVPDWLGRYTLLAAVEDGRRELPVYLVAEYVLRPERYDLDDLPRLPESAWTVEQAYRPPVAASDFQSAPVSPGVSDDDIPF